MPEKYDVLVIGGGPAGSTCAHALVAGGARVAVIDRAPSFPRVKLCGGWVSAPIWDILQLTPSAYPRGLWEWHTCHVHYRGKDHAIPCHGWFIRRYEFDDFLLRRSGADLYLGMQAKQIERDAYGMWTAAGLRARYLVGAGGTHCPVARMLAPSRPRRAVGVQELEAQVGVEPIARTRIGKNGEPELLLFDDIGGYGWNVPKSEWLNVGSGTVDATAARAAWRTTHDHLRAAGHLPPEAEAALKHIKGHSYYLFDSAHLDAAYRDQVFLIGDALGLAHPITAEGILPAAVSGRRAAEAILQGAPESYPLRLRRDPVFADYRRVHSLLNVARRLRDRLHALAGRSAERAKAQDLAQDHASQPLEPIPQLLEPTPQPPEPTPQFTEPTPQFTEPTPQFTEPTPQFTEPAPQFTEPTLQVEPTLQPPEVRPSDLANDRSFGRTAIARGFAWMFSGARLPAPRLLDLVLGDGE
jgi:flavin-dependent dehydrogenase